MAGQPVFMEVIGTKGMGKTSLLRSFQAIAEKNKALAVLFRAQKSDDLQRIIDELRNSVNEKISLGLLSKKYSEILNNLKVNREIFQISRDLPLGQTDQQNAEKTFETINEQLKVSAIVFLIDDVNQLTQISLKNLIDVFSKLSDKKIPYMLVLSSTGDLHISKELFRPVYVSQIRDREITELIEKNLAPNKLKMGEECLHAIIDDSQGHPLVLLTTCWTIYDKIKENERVISKGHYVAYLPTIMHNLARELFDDLYEGTSLGERDILRAIANLGGEASVSDIAHKLAKPLNTVTTLVLRLAKSGNVAKIARGKYRIFNRLYGKYVLQHCLAP